MEEEPEPVSIAQMQQAVDLLLCGLEQKAASHSRAEAVDRELRALKRYLVASRMGEAKQTDIRQFFG